ncbi:MAG: ATP-binding protein [Methylococcaceae bacterium]|nr:ATP-binding protein [Methylococcaceae bacterium]
MPKKISFKTINSKVTASMVLITGSIFILAIFFHFLSLNISDSTRVVQKLAIPSAILSISMLDEVDDMNANVLEYLMGSTEGQIEFEKNRIEFNQFMTNLSLAAAPNSHEVAEIKTLFEQFQRQINDHIFSRYDPEEEAWAKQRVDALIAYTGNELEMLLDSLKQSEIDNSRQFSRLKRSIQEDDFVGVRYYLELVDEAGDMVADLSQYITGDIKARDYFIQDSQNFEQFLSQLRPYKIKADEIKSLELVTSLYRVLRDGGFEVIRRYNPDQKKQALKAARGIHNELYYRLEILLDKLAVESTLTANQSLEAMSNEIRLSQYVFSILLFIVLLLCFSITFMSYKNVLRPLSKLRMLLSKLSEGNVDIELIYTDRKDEIGEIAVAIEAFKNNLITRNKIEKQLVKAKEKAELASQSKADFLASMSHEIRTPMNAVIGLIELLEVSNLDSNQQVMVHTIEESANSLLNIINDILDFSKIEAGKLEINKVSMNLTKIVESVMDSFAVNAFSNNVKLELFTDPDLPESVYSDSFRIRQVIINLLGNAIKFSTSKKKQGVVRVEVHLIRSSPKLAEIEIVVSDNGIGIKKDKVDQLFKPFVQADSTISRQYGGTGLGLSICHNILQLLGGCIKGKSQPGKGSSFTVNLSLKPLLPPSLFKPSKELVVVYLFESEWLRYCVTEYLKASHIEHRAVSSANLKQQMSLVTKGQLLIRLTDSKPIPEVDKSMHFYTAEEQQVIKYIIFDYNNQQERFIADDTFLLPIDPCLKISALIHAFNVVLGNEKTIESDDFSSIKKRPHDFTETDQIKAGHLILIAEDNKTNQRVISQQLYSLGYDCIVANDGVEAEEIYLQHDFDLVLTDCHMPNKDGYKLTQRLREIQQRTSRVIPIIAISADAVSGTDEKCLAVGMDDYISKPAKMNELQKKLLKWLLPKSTSLTVYKSSIHKVELDNSVLKDIYDGNIQHYIAGLQDFIEYSLPIVSHIIELSKQKNEYDYNQIEHLSHKLKSSSKMIGASQLSECIEKIEQFSKVRKHKHLELKLNEIAVLSRDLEKNIKDKIKSLADNMDTRK